MIWIPDVADEYKPSIGTVFEQWADVIKFYDTYSDKAGFSTRLGTIKKTCGIITHRHIKCHRSGKPSSNNLKSGQPYPLLAKRRHNKYRVTNCMACIKLKAVPNTSTYVVYGFVEEHNHCLIDKDNMDFSRKRRQIGYSDKHLIHSLSLNNIGATTAFKIHSSLRGGAHNVRGTKTEFKNFNRDIRLYIGEGDAQLIVDTLKSRTTTNKDHFFEYDVVDNELRFLFWADGVSKRNYEAFGDVLAFDATYKTNQ
jgi:zinc finger SWIM domain-containing protein 3